MSICRPAFAPNPNQEALVPDLVLVGQHSCLLRSPRLVPYCWIDASDDFFPFVVHPSECAAVDRCRDRPGLHRQRLGRVLIPPVKKFEIAWHSQ